MCGRYYIPDGNEFADINSLLDLIKKAYVGSPALAKMKTGEIFPSDIAPIITKSSPKLMKWGFEGFGGKGMIINARIETAAEKPMFRKPFSERRCLVPAGNYFEWRKDGSKKYKYAIKQEAPIYMAGLWQDLGKDGFPLFVILTRPALPELEFIHDRMPVILPEGAREDWLSGRLGTEDTRRLSSGGRFVYESAG